MLTVYCYTVIKKLYKNQVMPHKSTENTYTIKVMHKIRNYSKLITYNNAYCTAQHPTQTLHVPY